MKENNIPCKEVISHICETMGESQNSPRCLAIKEHLENCDCCSKYFTNVETTIKFYKDYNVKISDDAHNRLLDKLGLSE
ncbi:MAG: hypothetical protein ACEPO8_10555 [Rhodothermaceae bacterium]